MVWTLLTFFIVFFILRKFAFGRIAGLLEDRRRIVQENLEGRRARPGRGPAPAGGVQGPARRVAPGGGRASSTVPGAPPRRTGGGMSEELATERERGIAQAQQAIQAETRQSLDRIKTEVADLTLMATEKVLGRTLDDAEQRRLIDEALAGVDFSRLESQAGPRS
jgi:F-type H+-transporting ATPase subunit b